MALVRKMSISGITLDEATLALLLHRSRLDGLHQSASAVDSLVQLATSNMHAVFQRSTYHTIIFAYALANRDPKVQQWMHLMSKANIPVTVDTYILLLEAAAALTQSYERVGSLLLSAAVFVIIHSYLSVVVQLWRHQCRSVSASQCFNSTQQHPECIVFLARVTAHGFPETQCTGKCQTRRSWGRHGRYLRCMR